MKRMHFEKSQGNLSRGNDYTSVKGKAYDIEDALGNEVIRR